MVAVSTLAEHWAGRVRLLTLEQRGLYAEMILSAVREGALPKAPEDLSFRLGLPLDSIERGLTRLLPFFGESDGGLVPLCVLEGESAAQSVEMPVGEKDTPFDRVHRVLNRVSVELGLVAPTRDQVLRMVGSKKTPGSCWQCILLVGDEDAYRAFKHAWLTWAKKPKWCQIAAHLDTILAEIGRTVSAAPVASDKHFEDVDR